MDKIINGYTLKKDLVTVDSGTAKWGFAYRNGKEFFIKEFLSPSYPADKNIFSLEQYQSRLEACEKFEERKRKLYNALAKCDTGNVVTISNFFRWKTKYYAVTEKIEATPFSPEDVSAMAIEQKMLIMKTITHNVNNLHKAGIVHADIKPDNILFKRTASGNYTAKLIDFDSGFLEDDPPACGESFQGDLVYLAPEAFRYMEGGTDVPSTKADVFALGILFHQFLCGTAPTFDYEKYTYTFEAVIGGENLQLNPEISKNMRDVLSDMLEENPNMRPTLDEVFTRLSPAPLTPATPATPHGIKGAYFHPPELL